MGKAEESKSSISSKLILGTRGLNYFQGTEYQTVYHWIFT